MVHTNQKCRNCACGLRPTSAVCVELVLTRPPLLLLCVSHSPGAVLPGDITFSSHYELEACRYWPLPGNLEASRAASPPTGPG